jgi:hypothetical protein
MMIGDNRTVATQNINHHPNRCTTMDELTETFTEVIRAHLNELGEAISAVDPDTVGSADRAWEAARGALASIDGFLRTRPASNND